MNKQPNKIYSWEHVNTPPKKGQFFTYNIKKTHALYQEKEVCFESTGSCWASEDNPADRADPQNDPVSRVAMSG